MPRSPRLRPGPIGLALAFADVWRRLSPRQRKQVIALVRQHGPKVAKAAAKAAQKRRR